MDLYQQFMEAPTAAEKVPFVKVAIQCMKKMPRSKAGSPLQIVYARIIGHAYLQVKAERKANSCSTFCSQYEISKTKAADWCKLESEWSRLEEQYLAGASLAELITLAKSLSSQASPQHNAGASLGQCLLEDGYKQAQKVKKASYSRIITEQEADEAIEKMRAISSNY